MWNNKIKEHQEILAAYKEELSEIKAMENKLYHEEKWEYYKVMIQKQVDFKSTLTVDTIDQINDYTTKLYTFANELKADSVR